MVVTAVVGIFWVGYNAVVGTYPIHPYFTETYAAVIATFISVMILNVVFKDTRTSIE